MTTLPELGTTAPEFDLPADGGTRVKLSDFRGQPVVIYFYPKDDTSGCTKQAIAFTEDLDAYRSAGIAVVGISKDSPQSHDKFIAKHELGIRLASDEDTAVAQAYGVWVEKNMYGRKFMGIQRATFLLDGDGIVRHVWPKVRVAGHSAEVLETATSALDFE
ncbi:MAG: thioredoxin-dependent thiol peroxidase [Pseudomonadota bacterium]